MQSLPKSFKPCVKVLVSQAAGMLQLLLYRIQYVLNSQVWLLQRQVPLSL